MRVALVGRLWWGDPCVFPRYGQPTPTIPSLQAVDLCLDGCSKVQALMRDFLVHQFEEAEEVAAQDSSSTGATT